MTFTQSFVAMWHNVLNYLPKFLWAMVVLVVGWLLAVFISKIVDAAIRRTSLNKKLTGVVADDETKRSVNVETWISKGVYYFMLLIVLAAFFQVLGLTATTDTLSRFIDRITLYLPNLCFGVILILAAWVIAGFLKALITGNLSLTKLDEKLASEIEDTKKVPISKAIGEAVYWLVFLLFIPFILQILRLEGLLGPIQGMFFKMFNYLPNLLVTAFVLIVGWLIARIVQKVVVNFLLALGSEELSDKLGLATVMGQKKLAQALGLIVYVIVLIPVLILALETLNLEVITLPFSDMLNKLLGSVPYIFASIAMLLVAYIAGSVLARLAATLFSSFGFDLILVKLGIAKDAEPGAIAPSNVIGKLVHVGIMFLAVTMVCELLGFNTLGALIVDFLYFAGRVIVAVVIFMVGIYLANLLADILKGKGTQSELLAFLARVAILVFAGAVALRHIGLANEIINLAFGLLLGAVAVAIAIAFGVGGREFAARKLKEWEDSIKEK